MTLGKIPKRILKRIVMLCSQDLELITQTFYCLLSVIEEKEINLRNVEQMLRHWVIILVNFQYSFWAQQWKLCWDFSPPHPRTILACSSWHFNGSKCILHKSLCWLAATRPVCFLRRESARPLSHGRVKS